MKTKLKTVEQISELMQEIGQWSPLFDDEPDTLLMESVKGEKVSRKVGDNTFYSLVITDKKSKKQIRPSIVMGSEDKETFNVGLFTALRDYQSANSNTKYVAGETQRVFAY